MILSEIIYLESERNWFIGLAVLFLGIGVYQLYRQRRACGRASVTNTILLGVAAFVVAAIIAAPGQVALLLAKCLP